MKSLVVLAGFVLKLHFKDFLMKTVIEKGLLGAVLQFCVDIVVACLSYLVLYSCKITNLL